ncbi:Uncharacterized protein Adt_27148 [Abeliophyllum distichum]|uniref:DUF4216 domain-containing protein n=1 Tax=Abeliophyllum distichum TaxID=126358 RepID=A0ABD1RSX5_9LAMI
MSCMVYVVKRVRFLTYDHDIQIKTQNSSVSVLETGCDGRRRINENNVTSIDMSAEAFKDDRFILASQAQQVFYIEDSSRGPNWQVVQVVHHRSTWDMMGSNATEIDLLHNNNSSHLSLIIDHGNLEHISLHREDGEVDEIGASII